MDQIAELRRLYEGSINLSRSLKGDGLTNQNRALLVLYGNIVEHAEAYLILAEAGAWTATGSMVRSMLEALIDFINIETDSNDEYLAAIEFESLDSLRKAYEEAQSASGNAYLKEVREAPAFAEHLAFVQDRLKKITAEAAKMRPDAPNKKVALTKKEKFDRAKAGEAYRSVYRALSDEAHNNIGTLFGRGAEGGTFKFAIRRAVDPADKAHFTDSVIGMLAQTGVVVHERLKTTDANQMRELKDGMEKSRAAALEAALRRG